jgi:hypothetical protein
MIDLKLRKKTEFNLMLLIECSISIVARLFNLEQNVHTLTAVSVVLLVSLNIELQNPKPLSLILSPAASYHHCRCTHTNQNGTQSNRFVTISFIGLVYKMILFALVFFCWLQLVCRNLFLAKTTSRTERCAQAHTYDTWTYTLYSFKCIGEDLLQILRLTK